MNPTAPTQLDPTIVNLSKAIRQTESGGNPTAVGKSGEYGAYQYTPDTWAKDSAAAGVNVPLQQATLAQQNEVAYKKIAALKAQGLNVGQVASVWNSGDPNAYTGKFSDGKPAVGTNSYGVHYDVPAYAKSVATAYQTLKGGGQVQADPANPSSTANPSNSLLELPQQAQQPESLGDKILHGAEAVGNFIAPVIPDIYHDIKGDSTKTGLQQLGDLGSTGLTAASLIPGIGELGPVEATAARLGLAGEEGLNLGGRLAGNAAIGAGFGATNAIGAGETDPSKIAQSGLLGGAVGGGLGVAGEAVGGLLGKVADKTPTSQLESQAGGTKTLQNAVRDNSRGNTTPITTFEQKGYTPKLVVKDGKVNVDAITNEQGTGALDNDLEEESNNATELVKSMQGGVPTEQFKTDVLKEVSQNPDIRDSGNVSKAVSEVERKFSDLKNSYGDVLPWKAIDSIRKTMNKDYNLETRDVSRSIGDTARKFLYEGGEIPQGLLPSVSLNQAANTPLKTAMANESELIRARNFALKLRGSVVKGGKIGKYFWDTIGAMAGTAVGSAGGPVGAGLGTIAGTLAANKGRQVLEGSYFNPVLSKTANKIQGLVKSPVVQGVKNLTKMGILKSVK